MGKGRKSSAGRAAHRHHFLGPPAVIARDANGNSSGGGIRLAAIAVPIAVNTGQNTGPGFCRLYGSHLDFDPPKLASLYPSHEAYVERFAT